MIKFGPSGNSAAFAGAGHSKTEDSAAWVKSLGLDWFEYSFGRGVNMSDEKAISLRTTSTLQTPKKKTPINLSVIF